jgi:hypothetical protein
MYFQSRAEVPGGDYGASRRKWPGSKGLWHHPTRGSIVASAGDAGLQPRGGCGARPQHGDTPVTASRGAPETRPWDEAAAQVLPPARGLVGEHPTTRREISDRVRLA